MPPKASIIVLFHGQAARTRRCLDAVRKHTNGDYEVLAVDNASEKTAAAAVGRLKRGWPELKIVSNRENLPFSAAVNAAMRLARGRVLIWLNNDAVVGAGWLEALTAPLSQGFAASGPMTDHMAPPQQIGAAGKGLREADFLGGFCFALDRGALEKAGLLDERFVWGWEDVDYCLRLRQAGLRLALVRHAFVRHEGSATLSKMGGAERRSGDLANRRLILEKWPDSGRLGKDLRRLFRSTRADWHSYLPRRSLILQTENAALLRRASSHAEKLARGTETEVLSVGGEAGGLNFALRRASGDSLDFLDAETALKAKRITDFAASRKPDADHAGWRLSVSRAQRRALGEFDDGLTGRAAAEDYAERARLRGIRLACHGLEPAGRLSVITVFSNDDAPTDSEILAVLPENRAHAFEFLLMADYPSEALRSKLELLARADPRLKLHFRRSNPGKAAALNEGLRAARGSRILLLEPGARLSPGCLDALAESLSSVPNCGAAAAAVGGMLINGRPIAIPPRADAPALARFAQAARLAAGRPAAPASRIRPGAVLFPKRVLEQAGALDENLSAEDAFTDLILRLFRAGYQAAQSFCAAASLRGGTAGGSAASRARLEKKWVPGDDLAAWEGRPPARLKVGA